MDRRILTPHVRPGSYKKAFGISLAAHILLLLLLILGAQLLPAADVLEFGTGPGGGQGGEFMTVGLTEALGGGAGMYKPAIEQRPTAVPPPAPRPEPEEAVKTAPPVPDPNVFLENEKNRRRAAERARRSEQTTKEQAEPLPGQIPTTPEPGAGGIGGRSAGSGGGIGGGVGVLIGTGTGPGVIDSWYVRQVEQRIGANWLKTTLGELGRPVQSIVSFEVGTDGRIEGITLDKRSGITAVDLAAERAVRASNPLPPLPPELRGRRVRFSAHFDYPQR
ncbi:MAG: TonB family protein [Acidobacteria bacterium]|nr:MAG: TonB family protein [Acidobacteriota bacterium]